MRFVYSLLLLIGSSVLTAQPIVTLNPVSNVTSTGATFTGSISVDPDDLSPVVNRIVLGYNSSNLSLDSAGTIPGNQSSKITGSNVSVTRTYPGNNNNPPKLDPNTTYFYAMGAKDDLGRYTRSEILSFTTPALIAPDSLSADPSSVSGNSATIQWYGQSEHVQVRYSTSAFPGTATDGTSFYSGSAGEFFATTLTDSTTFFIRAFGKASASATYTANSTSIILSTNGPSGNTGTTIPAGYEGRVIPGSSGLMLDINDNNNGSGTIKTYTTPSYPAGDFPETARSPSGTISVSQWASVVWEVDFGTLTGLDWDLIIDLSQIAGATDPEAIAVLYRNLESESWSSAANEESVTITYLGSNLLMVSGLSADGFFALASDGSTNSLPVELESFSVLVAGSSINLTWKTISETDNAGFFIDRRNHSANHWTELAFIPGEGTTTTPKLYQFTDRPGQGNYNYRLRQMDVNGTESVFPAIEVVAESAEGFHLAQNYPNPFNPETMISYQLSEKSLVRLEVFDLNGKSVFVLVNNLQNPGNYSIPFNGSTLSSGIYYYVLTAGNQSLTRKMTLLR